MYLGKFQQYSLFLHQGGLIVCRVAGKTEQKHAATHVQIFKPGTPDQRMPGFLKLFLCEHMYACKVLSNKAESFSYKGGCG